LPVMQRVMLRCEECGKRLGLLRPVASEARAGS
jgi:hypothetical protein